ncbi:acyl-CoA dehydrogenase family protein [Pollutimonas harenae]|uniref:Acyl-CoA dehydrogenase n=1 Tax=Pollutimonas harenae TaxID=657015 RepID=A0A853H1U1_9BURK|nr:acyl-CoA dehydrogenase family protein [Pollutimonas harenae]NYT84124.1 acyl-CoA dehydrogenase [Pollutimonas harenae]TEA73456.1 acyl-CoA dehydrogenase [Pollutimonas harenae]
MDNLFTDSVERLFAEIATPEVIRLIEGGGRADALWQGLEDSGFLDVLLPEESEGAGLSLADVFPLFLLAGRYAVPVPFVQTLLARAWLHAAGIKAPPGSIAIAGFGVRQHGDALEAGTVAFGRVADWVLAQVEAQHVLLPVAAGRRELDSGHGSLNASLRWAAQPTDAVLIAADALPRIGLAALAAASHAPLLAGAASRVLELTLDYANQRTQFGKNIGRFQAIQNQISIMAERTWAARMAAQLACQGSGWEPGYLRAAVGKSRCSEAAAVIADIGHAVHGAIGITEEYDLQLYTRRLREWRLAAGTETYWARQIGTHLLQQSNHTALSFICEDISP